MTSAQKNHGRTLAPSQVREVASFIIQLDRMLAGMSNMLEAYKEEYGEELENELLGVVEGEVIDDEVQEEDGLDSSEPGVDTPLEEQEQDTIPEISDED